MKVGESVTVSLRIARSAGSLDERSLEEIAGHSVTKASPIIEDSMKAYLLPYDNDEFDIRPVQPEPEQFIPPSGYAEWDWNVRALRSGMNRIEMSIYGVLNSDTGDTQFRTAYDRTIIVGVVPMYYVNRFIAENWQWLWAAILVPGFTYWWTRRSKRRSQGRTRPNSH